MHDGEEDIGMANSIPSECRKFRAAVMPMATFMFVTGMAMVILLIVITDGFHFDRRALAIATGTALAFSIAYSWMLSCLFPAAFSAEGIYGHSFWARRRFVRWPDVASARTFRLANLRWLRVYAADGTVTWLPLFQSQGAEFCEEIRRLAPPGNPILSRL